MFCTTYVYGYDVDIVEETTIELSAVRGSSDSVEVRVMNDVFSAPHHAGVEVILYKDGAETERAYVPLDSSGRAHLKFDVLSGKYVLKVVYEGDAWSSGSEASLEFEVPVVEAAFGKGAPAEGVSASEGWHGARVLFILGSICVIAAAFWAYRSRFALRRLRRRLGLARTALVPVREVAKRIRATGNVSGHGGGPEGGDDVTGSSKAGQAERVLREHVAECFGVVASCRGEQWGKMSPSAFAKKYAGELGETGGAELRAFCERVERAAFDPAHPATWEEVVQIHKDAERLIRYF